MSNHIKTSSQQSAAAPSTATAGTSNATVFTLAKGEIGYIQNLDDAALAVKLGASAATNSFHRILKAGSAGNDGSGGDWLITDYVGDVSVCAMTGTASYIAWKRAIG